MRVPSQEEVVSTLRERIPDRAACVASRAGPAMRSAASSEEAQRLKGALGEVFLAFWACCYALLAALEPYARSFVFWLASVFKAREAEAKGLEAAMFGLVRGAWTVVEATAYTTRKKTKEYTGPGKEFVAAMGEIFAQIVEWVVYAAEPEETTEEVTIQAVPVTAEEVAHKEA